MNLGGDLNLLVALQALLEERNVTRAGARIGMGQPAMSGALARLRRHFDDELLLRIGRRYELTPLAQQLLPLLQNTVALAERTLKVGAGFRPEASTRTFTVTMSDCAVGKFVDPLVRLVRERERFGQVHGVVNNAGNQGFSLPNGLCFDADGDFVIGNFGTNVVEHLTRGGHWSLIADTVVWPDGSVRPIGKANFPAIDGNGWLWFSVTASAEAWRNRGQRTESDGYLAVIDDWAPGKPAQGRVVATDLGGTNELWFSDDGTRLYVAETGADHITRFRVGSDAP